MKTWKTPMNLNFIPAINLKMYGTLISNQPPTKMLREIEISSEESATASMLQGILQILPMNGCSCDRNS